MTSDLQKQNAKTALTIFCVIVFMIGLSFAAVPLYDLFCRVTGFAGTPQTASSAPQKVLDRVMKINFITSTARDMPWKFNAEQRSIKINIGQEALVNFKAHNPTDTDVIGTAIYNVTPLKAAKYFVKTQCFCFDRQVLNANQYANMPVIFYIDPAIVDDPDMDDLTTVSLSYTFFKSDSQDLEKALNAL